MAKADEPTPGCAYARAKGPISDNGFVIWDGYYLRNYRDGVPRDLIIGMALADCPAKKELDGFPFMPCTWSRFIKDAREETWRIVRPYAWNPIMQRIMDTMRSTGK